MTLKKPSRTRIAAQKKIQVARTQRLCSPPPPMRVTTADTPDRISTNGCTPTSTPIPTTRPATDTTSAALETTEQELELKEVANALLLLSGDAAMVTVTENRTKTSNDELVPTELNNTSTPLETAEASSSS